MAIITVVPSPIGSPIADAVSSAKSGDLILVSSGNYPEGTVTIATDNIRIIAKSEGKAIRQGATSVSSAFIITAEKGVVISGFKMEDYTGDVIDVTDGKNHRIIGNTIIGTDGNGINLQAGSKHLLWRNVVRQAGGSAGISVESEKSLIAQNETKQNTGDGILLGGSSNLAISNTLAENGSKGVVNTGINNLLYQNTSTEDTTVLGVINVLISKLLDIRLGENEIEPELEPPVDENESEVVELPVDEPHEPEVAEPPVVEHEPEVVPPVDDNEPEVNPPVDESDPEVNLLADLDKVLDSLASSVASAAAKKSKKKGDSDSFPPFKIPHVGTISSETDILDLLLSTWKKIRK